MNNPALELLAIGKKLGLSFMEMNELTCQNLLDLADIFCSYDDEEREADQDDIDKLLA